MPLNGQLTERGATLRARDRAPRRDYRLYALPGTAPPKPGLVRVRARRRRSDRARGLGDAARALRQLRRADSRAAGHRHARRWPTAAACRASSAKRWRSPAPRTSRTSAAGAPTSPRCRSPRLIPSAPFHAGVPMTIATHPFPPPPRAASCCRRGAAGAAPCSPRPPSCARRRAPKIRIGYWPIAAGLPFFAAIEQGYFKEAGLDVEPLKFAGAQQVMEAMLVGPLRRQLQRHRLGQPRHRRDRAARASSRSSAPTRATRSTCSTSSSSPRTARSRRWPTSRASASPPAPASRT